MAKVVLITGGAKGIGRGMAVAFYQAGYQVCITYHTSFEQALALKEKYGMDIYELACNDTKMQEQVLEEIIKKHGKIDVLINNTGISESTVFSDITDDAFGKMLSVNLVSAFQMSKAVLNKSMLHHKQGSIINISSIWGVTGASCEVHYSASKAGLIGMTKALAKELGPSQITVNSIAPGVIKTDMLKNLSKQECETLVDQIPLGRIGEPEDIATVAVFLASEGASYITGQVITVDGGMCI